MGSLANSVDSNDRLIMTARQDLQCLSFVFVLFLFLAHLSYAQDELLRSLFVRRPSVRPPVGPSMHPSVNIFKRPPLKPLSQFCSNFIWSLLRLGERKIAKMAMVRWPRWPPYPYMVKPLKIFFSRMKDALWLNLCTNHRGREVYQNC